MSLTTLITNTKWIGQQITKLGDRIFNLNEIKELKTDMQKLFWIDPIFNMSDVIRIINFEKQGIDQQTDIELLDIIWEEEERKKAYNSSKCDESRTWD